MFKVIQRQTEMYLRKPLRSRPTLGTIIHPTRRTGPGRLSQWGSQMRKHPSLYETGTPKTEADERAASAVDEYLKVEEAAGLVRVHADTLRGWCHRGLLRRYGGPRTWRINRQELLVLFASGLGSQREPVVKLAAELLRKVSE